MCNRLVFVFLVVVSLFTVEHTSAQLIVDVAEEQVAVADPVVVIFGIPICFKTIDLNCSNDFPNSDCKHPTTSF